MSKTPRTYRLSNRTIARIEALEKLMELTATDIIEQAVKELAEKKGVVITDEHASDASNGRI